jgi:hypothetical protein
MPRKLVTKIMHSVGALGALTCVLPNAMLTLASCLCATRGETDCQHSDFAGSGGVTPRGIHRPFHLKALPHKETVPLNRTTAMQTD